MLVMPNFFVIDVTILFFFLSLLAIIIPQELHTYLFGSAVNNNEIKSAKHYKPLWLQNPISAILHNTLDSVTLDKLLQQEPF